VGGFPVLAQCFLYESHLSSVSFVTVGHAFAQAVTARIPAQEWSAAILAGSHRLIPPLNPPCGRVCELLGHTCPLIQCAITERSAAQRLGRRGKGRPESRAACREVAAH